MQSPANLVFLVVIFLLIVRVFMMDQQLSKLRQQVTNTVQRVAIDELEEKKDH